MRSRYGRRAARRRLRRRRVAWTAAALAVALGVLTLVSGVPRNFLGPRPAAAAPASGYDNPADAAVVLCNAGDPESVELANFYATRRGISPDRIVTLHCVTTEDISREEYDATIAAPPSPRLRCPRLVGSAARTAPAWSRRAPSPPAASAFWS